MSISGDLPSTKPLSLSSLSSFKDSLISSTKNTLNNITDGANELLNTGTAEISSISSNSSGSSSTSFLSNMTWQTWIIIILVLALFGLNIFTYLAKGTAELTSLVDMIFGPILKLLGYATIQTTKQVIEKGTDGINAVSNTAVSGLDKLEKVATGKQAQSLLPVNQNANNDNIGMDEWQENPLDKALHHAQMDNDSVEPDQANSSIQSSGKSGYCYIGDSNGVRTCAKVGVNDTCMSGDIFPSNDICINPNLRA